MKKSKIIQRTFVFTGKDKPIATMEETANVKTCPDTSHDLITVIVQRGKADRVVKRAMKAGAGGATIWFGRGGGIREKLGLLGIAISPEKEIILIITPRNITDLVFQEVVKAGKLDIPGQGVAYVTELRHVAGFLGEAEIPTKG